MCVCALCMYVHAYMLTHIVSIVISPHALDFACISIEEIFKDRGSETDRFTDSKNAARTAQQRKATD